MVRTQSTSPKWKACLSQLPSTCRRPGTEKREGCHSHQSAVAAAAGALSTAESYPTSEVRGQQPRVPGCDGPGTAERSYPVSEVRGDGQEEIPHV